MKVTCRVFAVGFMYDLTLHFSLKDDEKWLGRGKLKGHSSICAPERLGEQRVKGSHAPDLREAEGHGHIFPQENSVAQGCPGPRPQAEQFPRP